MAALFQAWNRESGQDLAQWLFSMFTIPGGPWGIFSYRYAPLQMRSRAFLLKKEVYYGITSSNG